MRRSLAWEDNFPRGYGHTSIAFLKRCLGYEDAKKGDFNAAKYVVSRCIKQNRIYKLQEEYPNAVLLPVICKNQLPLALSHAIGLPIWYGVSHRPDSPRKTLCAMRRLLHNPIFYGYIEKNINYILVDDVVTQGGTIAALREFVIVRGGKVVAVVALAYAFGSHIIAPLEKYIFRLLIKFGIKIVSLLHVFGIITTVQELTNSQAKYLLRFSSIKNIHKSLLKNAVYLKTDRLII